MAMTFAMAYALCVLAPPVALAFIDDAAAPHCLTDAQPMPHIHNAKAQIYDTVQDTAHGHHVAAHDHGAAADHHRTSPDPGEGKAGADSAAVNCCGYFCVSAMPASPAPDVLPAAGILPAVGAVDNGITGRGPDRIDRPPIALLSL